MTLRRDPVALRWHRASLRGSEGVSLDRTPRRSDCDLSSSDSFRTIEDAPLFVELEVTSEWELSLVVQVVAIGKRERGRADRRDLEGFPCGLSARYRSWAPTLGGSQHDGSGYLPWKLRFDPVLTDDFHAA